MKNWRQSCDATRGKAAFCFRLVSSYLFGVAIFILLDDKRTDFCAVLSTGFQAVAILPLMLFIYCLLFEFK